MATLLAALTDPQLDALRGWPEVAIAERRASREARWRPPGGPWGRAEVFAVEHLGVHRLATFTPQAGATAAGPGEALVERASLAVMGARLGDAVEVVTAAGRPATLTLVGVVHDPSLAPAGQERAANLYVTPETFARLGEPQLDEVRILVADRPLDPAAVDAQAAAVAQRLDAQGVTVREVRVPPPGEHPHEAPSRAVLLVLWLFAALTVGLAAVLSASLLSITLARQVREIAVMKTLGASRRAVAGLYVAMVGAIALAALAASALPTALLARAGIDAVAGMLNVDVASYAVPLRVIAAQVAIGLGLPLAAAAPLIARASRRTVVDTPTTTAPGPPPAAPGRRRWATARRSGPACNAVRVRGASRSPSASSPSPARCSRRPPACRWPGTRWWTGSSRRAGTTWRCGSPVR
ncbi:MAG: FtsX-like permease family protein [Myxococcota bacterium]